VKRIIVSKDLRLICLALSVFVFSPFLSLYGKDCAKEPDMIAIADCHQKRYEKADKELNKVYSEVMKDLTPEAQKKLKEAQKAWLKYRDAAFAFAIEYNKDTRSYGSVVVADYKARVVEKRVLEIKFVTQSPADPPVEW
jgi:uncharacterized protein YecT (DUF1311 family)